jgi:RimJ/RimL family protein N-acetyltransferase
MKERQRIETARLVLRKPNLGDADAVFSRYAGDPNVTRLLGWPTHRYIEDTRAFLEFCNAEWQRWPAGPYLIEDRAGRLLGSTGLGFETLLIAATGYVLAEDAWGHGYATEALGAMVELSFQLGLHRLHALCHPENLASARVLEKCGFQREAVPRRAEFPNLPNGGPQDCWCYSRGFD